ncbi:MAG: type II toxin-antitoxin system VapC family toxin [Cryomorphaceae bacterium]|nr:type II toxin-antitoxin system VapC family toxin [Flavobacteriales bacterium]
MSKVLCDTHVLIELYKGNETVFRKMNLIGDKKICISDVTAGELLFGARNKGELEILKNDIKKINCLPINVGISGLAIELISQYALSHRLSLPDALIAATSVVHELPLYTLNKKDFRYLKLNLYG